MRTTYNKLNNHALVFIEITKAWLFFIIIITKLANKAIFKCRKFTSCILYKYQCLQRLSEGFAYLKNSKKTLKN